MFRFSCAIRAFSIGDHLAQRDDRAVLAAGRLLWWFLSAFKRDVTDPVLGEQVRDLGMHLLPHAVRVGERSEPQAHAQARGCRLHNLEQLDSGGAIEQGPEGQRRDADLLAAVGGKGEHISGAALDANCGQGTATWTRIGTQEDAVAQIVAHNRLHPIGKVRDQDRVRLLTRRDRPIVGIHWLEHDPVEVHVLPALLAAGADEEALGRGVGGVDLGVERFGDPVVFASRKLLADGLHLDPVQAQAASFLLAGKPRDHAGVADEEGRAESVELGDQLRQRRVHREDPHRLAVPPAGFAYPGDPGDTDEVATGRHHHG